MQLLMVPGIPWLWLQNSHFWFCLHKAFSSVSMLSLHLFLIRTHVMEFRSHLDKLEWSHLKILHLIISAKTIYPSRNTFMGSVGPNTDLSLVFGDWGAPFRMLQLLSFMSKMLYFPITEIDTLTNNYKI